MLILSESGFHSSNAVLAEIIVGHLGQTIEKTGERHFDLPFPAQSKHFPYLTYLRCLSQHVSIQRLGSRTGHGAVVYLW
jgi:hypothetical protein